jgi:hypothetical protein
LDVDMNRTMLVVVFLACRPSIAPAQEMFSSACEIPVVVADYNNRLVRYLKPSDFSVQIAGERGTIADVSIDAGPKRIAIVLDSSSKVPQDEWRLETEMAEELASHARTGDQFFLAVVGSGSEPEAFSSSAELTARLHKLEGAHPNSASNEQLYDTLAEAARNFDPPKFGDTIFLLGHYRDSGSSVSLDSLRDLILRKGLRFFGISFEDRFAGQVLQPNKPLAKNFQLAPLEALSRDTGYFISYHAVRNLAYPGQIPLFENFLTDLYTWISEPYRVEVSAPPVRDGSVLDVSVSEMETRKINQRGIHSPHLLYGCVQAKKATDLPHAIAPQ